MQQAEEEPEILKRFQGFSNSFRIIAKQNSIRKEGQVFVIDADFDVLYTINPSPAYQAALEIYQRKHGKLPPSYQTMQMAYELFCKRIHDHMVKLPLCREYFSMLAMINFFSGYFSTLKKHRKIPKLPSLEVEVTKGCPSLFPHLPIRSYSQEKIVYLPLLHMKKMMNSHRSLMERYLVQQLKRHRNPSFTFSPDYNFHLQEEVLKPWAAIFKEVILESVSPPLRRFLIKSDFKELNSLPSASLESMTNRLTGWLLENPSINNQSEESVVHKFINDYIGRSYNFLEKAGASFLAIHSSPEKASQIFDEVFKDKSSNQKIEIDTSRLFSVTGLKAEISPEELEEGKRVVGGCGIKLEKQKVEHSHEAADIWQNNWSLLQGLKPEMWQMVSSDDARHSQGAIFRLGMEDVPPEVDNDYTWMESLFLIPRGLSPELFENRWKITQAIAADNVEEFSRLVKEVPGLKNMRDRNGRALLHEAALADNPFYLDTLLKMGLSCQEEDAQGYLPIHYVAMKGNLKHLEILLGYAPTSLNAQSHSQATPLMVASQHQQTQAVRLLLFRKPKFLVSTEGYTPFHAALHEGHVETIRAFLDHPDLILPVLNMLAEEGGTPLMLACELDSLEFVQRLIKMGADPKVARKDGVTAMEISILRHCDPVLQCLLAHASPSDRTIESAAKEGSVKTIEILAQSPSFFAYRNAYQDTALHLMIRNGNMQAAIACIDKCADPSYLNVKNLGKETLFSMSASLGIWQLVDALYQKRAEIDLSLLFKMEYHPLLKEILDTRTISDSDLQYYLLIAAKAGNYLAITQVLESKGAKLEKLQGSHGWQLLHYLAKADGIFLFRRLIRQAGDYLLPIKEEGGRTLAYIAAEYGSSRVLKFLLENLKKLHIPLHKHFKDRHLLYGVIESRCVNHCTLMLEMFKEDQLENAELDLEGTRPVHLAARLGLFEIFHILDKSGVDFAVQDRHGFTSLDYAARSGAGKVVKFLLKKGGAVFITLRALFFAASQENKRIWKLLLKQHPSQDALDKALIVAIENGDDEAFLALLEGGASIDYVTDEGWTPLLMASRSGQSKILQEILKREPSNKKEINGNGPLHLASIGGYTHCLRLLLEAGYRDEINRQGKTALDLASGHQEIQTLLKDFKHTPNPKIEAFAHAIQQGDANAIIEILEKLAPDEEIFLETQQMCGTPLQLLIRLGMKKSTIAYALKEFKGNPNLQDSEGNTLAHLLLMAGISPLEIPNIDLSITNHRGQTLLHLAAQFAIPRIIEQLLEKSNPSDLEMVDKKGWTSIYYAIEGNRVENVRFLCRKGANFKHAAYNLSTPLMFACQRGVLSIIRGLLEEGADPNQAGSFEGWVPLSLACEKKDNEMTLALLGAGAKLDKRADTGVRVIHLAAQRENHLLMRIFSAQGYSLKLKDDKGMQPIHYAASSGKANALKTIAALERETVQSTFDLQEIDQPENKSMAAFKGATSLHFAARFGTSETVRTLLDLHSNPEAKTSVGISTLSLAAANEASVSVLGQLYDYRFTQKTDELCKAIQSAIMNDQIDAVMSLYERGMLVSGDLEEGYSGLHFACQFNALQTTQWLLSQDADPYLSCSTGENAFEISAVHSGYEQFSLLLEYAQPDLDQVNGRGEALIHLIARAGKLHHMMLLILYGASINNKNIRGETPLHIAVKEGHLSIARLLIACGADMYVRTEQGKTPFDLVSTSPDHPIKKGLFEFQRILQETNKQETPLHRAVRFQDPLAVMILTHFEKLDQPDSEGITPLQLAVQLGQMQSVINLIQRGAGVNVADKQGRTPLLVASVESPNPDLVKLLLKAGANPMVKDASGRTVFEQVQKMDFPKKTEVLEIFNKKLNKIN
jgi:ankyrin repeat protein